MGQAGAAPETLPDPNEPASATAASADDLLAQLAGEEIDRLLAETEDGAAPPASPTAVPEPVADAPAVEPAVNAASASINTVEQMGDQLDQLLKEIETPKPAPPEAPAEAPAETTTIAQLGAATTNSEVSALIGEQVGASVDDVLDDGSPLPIYVRALELFNAPFAALPTGLREFLGKVAILTMFNSIAVLVYVLIFRRRH